MAELFVKLYLLGCWFAISCSWQAQFRKGECVLCAASPVAEFLFPSILLPKQTGSAVTTLLFNKLILDVTDLLSEQTDNQTLLRIWQCPGRNWEKTKGSSLLLRNYGDRHLWSIAEGS